MAVIANKFVFVHVPKTGGTSIAAALGGTDRTIPQHVPFKVLEHHGLPGIGFLRDPWHRMVSLFYFLQQSPPRHLQRVNPKEIKAMGFKKWLLEGENWLSNEPVDGECFTPQSQRYGKDVTFSGIEHCWPVPPQQRRPVMWYLRGCKYIGKTETLQPDMDKFATALGIPKVKVSRINITKRKPHDWRKEYDNETIEHVASYFADDIRAGGYQWH